MARMARRGKASARLRGKEKYVIPMDTVGLADVARVGGKNASLGEMLRELGKYGIRVPSGVIVTTEGYRHFIAENQLESVIKDALKKWKHGDIQSLERV